MPHFGISEINSQPQNYPLHYDERCNAGSSAWSVYMEAIVVCRSRQAGQLIGFIVDNLYVRWGSLDALERNKSTMQLNQ
jgi:hypothetical protein